LPVLVRRAEGGGDAPGPHRSARNAVFMTHSAGEKRPRGRPGFREIFAGQASAGQGSGVGEDPRAGRMVSLMGRWRRQYSQPGQSRATWKMGGVRLRVRAAPVPRVIGADRAVI